MKTEYELWIQWQAATLTPDLTFKQQWEVFKVWLAENYTEVDGLWRHNEDKLQ